MRYLLAILLVSLTLFTMAGCGTTEEPQTPEVNDEDPLQNDDIGVEDQFIENETEVDIGSMI